MNILFFVCDTLRADHLGCYGYFRNTSPNIDRLAREGVLFEDFYDAGCPTGPAFTCMYTGLYPIHHKFYRFLYPNARQVDDMIFTMPEMLRGLGYTTAGFHNLLNMMDRPKHLVKGYEFYINLGEYFPHHAFHTLRCEEVNRRLIPWIRSYSDEKFFLFVHYWDPHGPYNQPKKYRDLFQHQRDLSDLEIREAPAGYKYIPGWGTIEEVTVNEKPLYYDLRASSLGALVDLYDGEIAYMDHAIGEVIQTLEDEGVLEETLIILTSDHGEQLCQHRSYGWQHAGLHDAVTHVPLIMRYPKKLPKGVRVKGFCQHIDILPTLLDLLGVGRNVLDIDGRSLMPLLNNEEIRDLIFMEHTSGQRSVRTAEWHLIDDETIPRKRYRELELYNVKEDPMETVNLAKNMKDKAKLKEALRGWIRENLKEGERDPAIYADERGWGYSTSRQEYILKERRLLDMLKIYAPEKW